MADPLIRVSVASDSRRVDLALPGAVPVAELVPELARSVGVLDPARSHAGYVLVGLDGRRLVPSLGLGVQQVCDGDLLTVVTGSAVPWPRQYDDPAEALADAVDQEMARWEASQGRAVRGSAGGIALGLAAGLGMPAVGARVALPLAVVLVVAVLAAGLLPRLALTLSGAGGREAADAGVASADARLAHRILTAMTVAVGVLLVAVAPVVVGLGRWGIALAVLACLALLLHTRHRRDRGQVLAGCVLGLGGLAASVAMVLRLNPSWRPEVAVLLGAAAIAALTIRPPRAATASAARLARLGDLLEAAVLLALPPLLVLASGLLDHLPV